jgi:glycogen operon protein
VRRFWRGDPGMLPELAARLAGSADIFDRQGRRPWASVNFVTVHDGFTLLDVVSYESKHNEANGEDNRDGHNENISTNHGIEGPSDDPEIVALRRRHCRNLLATLLISQGTPMLLAGDEFGHTQNGNNNAYCQDNETTWLNWSAIDSADAAMIAFVRRLIRLRLDHPVLRWPRFLHGTHSSGGVKDITWLSPDGSEMTTEQWQTSSERCLGLMLNGEAGTFQYRDGTPAPGELLLLLFNGHDRDIPFTLPGTAGGGLWRRLLDTSEESSSEITRAFNEPAELAPLTVSVWRASAT